VSGLGLYRGLAFLVGTQTSEHLDLCPSPSDTLMAQLNDAFHPSLLRFERTVSILISREEECPLTSTGAIP
jgi:hypothetical protein